MRGTRGQIIGGYLWAVITDCSRLVCKESGADYYKTAGDYGIALCIPTLQTPLFKVGWLVISFYVFICLGLLEIIIVQNKKPTNLAKVTAHCARAVYQIQIFLCVYKSGDISYGFKMADKKPDLSDFYPRAKDSDHTTLVKNLLPTATWLFPT